MVGQTGTFSCSRAGLAARKGIEFERQKSLGIIRIALVEELRQNQTQHPVTQEFETFIRGLRISARMGQRTSQHCQITKCVAQRRCQRRQFLGTRPSQ